MYAWSAARRQVVTTALEDVLLNPPRQIPIHKGGWNKLFLREVLPALGMPRSTPIYSQYGAKLLIILILALLGRFPRCVEARCRGGFSSGVEARFLFLLPLDGRARGEAIVEARFPFLLMLDGRVRGEAIVEARARFWHGPYR